MLSARRGQLVPVLLQVCALERDLSLTLLATTTMASATCAHADYMYYTSIGDQWECYDMFRKNQLTPFSLGLCGQPYCLRLWVWSFLWWPWGWCCGCGQWAHAEIPILASFSSCPWWNVGVCQQADDFAPNGSLNMCNDWQAWPGQWCLCMPQTQMSSAHASESMSSHIVLWVALVGVVSIVQLFSAKMETRSEGILHKSVLLVKDWLIVHYVL